MASVLYITLLDQFHPGIYSSQVIDVCEHLKSRYKLNIRLVAFLSVKELIRTKARSELKKLSPNAIVLPAFPKIRFFELTAILLFFVCLFTGARKVICRNVFCTRMALYLKRSGIIKKVILDGRSAMAAEIEEYDVFPVEYLRKKVRYFETDSVLHADFRMAVSNKLIEYWKEKYKYSSDKHVVIPCTLDKKFFKSAEWTQPTKSTLIRKDLGFSDSDIVLVYAGSTAPWQSFGLLETFILPLLSNERVKLLFLSKSNDEILKLQEKYINRVAVKWLSHSEVGDYLASCDYGILLREQSVTNYVASPTKFGEYLYAGLPVLISENLGDFTKFSLVNHCGIIFKTGDKLPIVLNKPTDEMRRNCRDLANKYFCKDSKLVANSYAVLVNEIEN